MAPKIISVSQLNRYVKSLLDGASVLSSVYVQGEISNLSAYNRSGHLYFTIKDDQASIKAVMFRSSATAMRFIPENGMQIVAMGSVSLYEKDGSYQINVTDLIPSGAGALALAYEQLKERLSKEGLFDNDKKKPLPEFPKRIGIITSSTGAALQDILTALSRRYPIATVITVHSKVQGIGAAKELAEALELLNRRQCCDVIIIGRGGGSIEDLWSFNEEVLVRAVAGSQIPIISAVGHETDFTLCDFAADLRAPTPSSAAELVAPDINAMQGELISAKLALKNALKHLVHEKENALSLAKHRLKINSPVFMLDKNRQDLNNMIKLFNKTRLDYFKSKQAELSEKIELLSSLSPLNILKRGYSITTNSNDNIVYSGESVSVGDTITTTLRLGKIESVVKNISKE